MTKMLVFLKCGAKFWFFQMSCKNLFFSSVVYFSLAPEVYGPITCHNTGIYSCTAVPSNNIMEVFINIKLIISHSNNNQGF
jgi:hypothetical protein